MASRSSSRRQVADGVYGESESALVGEGAVGHGVGCDRNCAAEIGGGNEAVAPVRTDGEGADAGDHRRGAGRMDRGIARDRELRHAQHIAVHVDIAVEHAGGRDVERGVFVGDVGLVVRDGRRVTPGQQRQAERRPGRVAICIYEIDGNIEIHLCPGVEHGTANSGERKRIP